MDANAASAAMVAVHWMVQTKQSDNLKGYSNTKTIVHVEIGADMPNRVYKRGSVGAPPPTFDFARLSILSLCTWRSCMARITIIVSTLYTVTNKGGH